MQRRWNIPPRTICWKQCGTSVNSIQAPVRASAVRWNFQRFPMRPSVIAVKPASPPAQASFFKKSSPKCRLIRACTCVRSPIHCRKTHWLHAAGTGTTLLFANGAHSILAVFFCFCFFFCKWRSCGALAGSYCCNLASNRNIWVDIKV